MGRMGTFNIICRFSRFFAAAVPVREGINPERIAFASEYPDIISRQL